LVVVVRVLAVLAAITLTHRPEVAEAAAEILDLQALLAVALAAAGVVMAAAVARAGYLLIIVALVILLVLVILGALARTERCVLFGPVQHGHSPRLM
jgi:hypothetical protein